MASCQNISDSIVNSSDLIDLEDSLDQCLQAAQNQEAKEAIFSILLPVVMVLCLISLVVSLSVVCCTPFVKRPMTATIRLSLSLSAANAAFAFIVFLGTLVHSYLPFVYGITFHSCFQLTVEAVRLGIILIQVYHLVVVALVHYFGTLRPLRYASTLTPKCLKLTISALWIIPILGMFVTFASIPMQGYQSEGCNNNHFRLNGMTFRYIWACLFFGPTILLVVVYSHIFYILSQRGRNIICVDQRRNISKNVKTVKTTAMIVGLFIVGWCPAVLAFLIVCDDCPIQIKNVRASIALFTSTYLLFILKVLADSFIYVIRLPEIREAMKLLKDYLLHKMGFNLSRGFQGRRRFNSKFSSTFRSTFISSHSSMKERSLMRQTSATKEAAKISVELRPLNGHAERCVKMDLL